MSETSSGKGGPTFGAVVLAGGSSTRMNAWKPGILIGEFPLIVHALRPAMSLCHQVVIVGGFRFEDIVSLVREYGPKASLDLSKVVFVNNELHRLGMFSSVRAGVLKSDTTQDGTFIVPGDMPCISPHTYEILAGAFSRHSEADIFFPSIKDIQRHQKKGHPVLMRRSVASSLLTQPENAILRDILKTMKSEICLVEDQGIYIDIDEERDLEKYHQYLTTAANNEKGM